MNQLHAKKGKDVLKKRKYEACSKKKEEERTA